MDNKDSQYKTFTFFFSDIEGSTNLLQKLGDNYSKLLDKEQKILKEEFSRYNGEVIDAAGDGFFVVFRTAKDALSSAVSIQKRISETDWVGGTEIKIRIGIHTGEAKITEAGYVGLDVHRGARIMPAAHGGQVLISESTKTLVENELPHNVNLKYLGRHDFKDLPNPEKIYQLVIYGLPSDFPSINSLSTKTNLPTVLTKLIGRESEMKSLMEIMLGKDTRLLTITGPGGIGKTSIGLNLCNSLVNSFEDGVYAVFLSSISDTELVAQTIGKSLGLSESSEKPCLIDFLANKNLLLFLDNFEQVTAAAGVVSDIILNCPGVKILVTSRIILRAQMEKEYSLNPLSLPSEKGMQEPDKLTQFTAIQLFVERAKNVNKDFRITIENAEAIAEICIQLDGLPLAIELASARTKLFTPQMILSRLSNSLNLLKNERIDLPERHHTLRQTISWSYDLLSPEERKLFETMAVFVGGSTFDAIEKICGDLFTTAIELVDSVQGLIEKSLLRRIDADKEEPRFIMLFTIREFSNELFEKSVDFESIKDKHAYYYLELAEEAEPHLTGKDIKYWTDLLNAEIDNYRAALKWSEITRNTELALRLCASLWRFWIIRKNLKEGLEKMKYVLSMPFENSQKLLRAKVLNGIGTIMHELNNYEMAFPLIEESLKIYRELNDKKGELYSLINLFWVLTHLGQLDKAEILAEKCFTINNELGEKRADALIYNNLGWLNFMRGNLTATKNYFLKSLEIRIKLGDPRGEGFSSTNLAWVEIVLGNYEQAEEHLKKAIDLHTSLFDKHLTAWTLSNYGFLELYRGNFKNAEELVKEAISKMKESVNEWGISYETLLYGIIQYQSKDVEAGMENIKKSLSFYRKIKSKWGVRRALLNLGIVYFEMNDLEKSKECLKEALEVSILLKDKLGFIQVLENTALISLANSNDGQAKLFYEAAKSIRNEIKAPMNYLEEKSHSDNMKKMNITESKDLDLDNVLKSAMDVLNNKV